MGKLFLFLCFIPSAFCFGQEQFDFQSAKKFQNKLNEEYSDAKTSPLEKADLASFQTLDYFPISEKYFVVSKFVRTAEEKPFKMKTSTNRKPIYIKYGEVHFAIEGKSFKLNVYRDIELSKNELYKDYLFLPFSDLTSGNESYIGGR